MEKESNWQRMKNPYSKLEGYQCFGCSPDNKQGLRMKFITNEEKVICDWEPQEHLQGYLNVLHGGIQATLMDEIACWLVHAKLKTSGVTSNLEVRYIKPVPTDKGALRIVAKLQGMRKNLADVDVELFSPDGVKCAEAVVTYFTFPAEYAKKKLHFPDPEEFLVGDKVNPEM